MRNPFSRKSGDIEWSRLRTMFAEIARGPMEIRPSKYWEWINKKNLRQLKRYGYINFKQTVALNYFTWLGKDAVKQIHFLKSHLPPERVEAAVSKALSAGVHPFLSGDQAASYNELTYLLWEYASLQDPDRMLEKLHEPEEGNPPRTSLDGKPISQDLANSFLEFLSVFDPAIHKEKIRIVAELGAGYGRTAFVFLSLLPDLKYLVIDIPPALLLSEKYLSSQFPFKRIFRFRPFRDFEEIREEYEASDIAFLLPNQLDRIPKKSVDLFLNISSLHEMRSEQIRAYFSKIDRITRSYFYMKQWKISIIPFEKAIITETDYPIPKSWRQIYHRDCKVQSRFFEALFQLDP